MRLRRRAFHSIVGVVVPATILLATNAIAQRLGHSVEPTFQEIFLKLDANQSQYSGNVTIRLNVNEGVNSFRIHSRTSGITSLTLAGDDGQVGATYQQDEEDETVTIQAETSLAPGEYVLSLAFESPFNTQANALYRLDVRGEGYAFTQFEADAAREAFPCFDEPIFKIPFRMTLQVPEEHMAVSNTPVQQENVAGGQRTVIFKRTKPLPTYLLAIATGPLDTVAIPGLSVPGRIVTVQGQTHLAENAIESTPPILAELETYFGSPYPYEKLDLIAVPEFWAGAMENAGAVTYRETILLNDPATMTIARKRRLARVTSHELAHMWFGDLVTMEWWDDLWLNESFAEWMSYKIVGRLYPELGSDLSIIRRASRVMTSDARPSAEPIRQPIEDTEDLLQNVGALYAKGLVVLNMFEHWIGEETFRAGILNYIQVNKWGNATAEDLWQALAGVSDVSFQEALATFVEQPGVPMVTVEMTDDNETVLRQKRFANYGVTHDTNLVWHIPVTLKYSMSDAVRTTSLLLTDSVQTVALGDAEIDWVYPNADAVGYYRWRVPTEMMLSMARGGSRRLSIRERVAYLLNLGALLDAGTVSGAEFLKTIERFSTDVHPEVTRAVISSLGKVRRAFVPDDLRDEFAVYVRHTLSPALKHIGLTPQEGEKETVTLLRPDLIEWLGRYGRDPEVLTFAKENAPAILSDASNVDPSLEGTLLSLASLEGDMELWEEYRSRFESATVPRMRSRYLHLMGSFRDPEIVDRALEYALEGPLRPQELGAIPQNLAAATGKSGLPFNWLMDNYDAIVENIPRQYLGYLPYYASGCSRERLRRAQEFFSEPEHAVPGTEESLVKVADQVEDCVGLRAREGNSVRKYLKEVASK